MTTTSSWAAGHRKVGALALGALLVLLSLLTAPAALAQTLPDLGHMALRWTHGDFRSPLICDVEGGARRVLRRVEVRPDPRVSYRPTNRITFHDLEAPAVTRCYLEDGTEALNVVGSLQFIFEGRRGRTDTADRDFQDNLKREGGFDYAVTRGRLRVGTPGVPEQDLRSIDFSGATARFSVVGRGSDAYQRLSDFGRGKKISVAVTAKDGTRLSFDLFDDTGR